ncbi:MAG TPA: trypsin-like peptidase domain-containing protein [Burkholderiaceae bacterium]|jgi:S1-C subfamily serine protease|nr:trypsin-like peptidase domain-containing protein [Burkholderiaceae bacterium]
MSLTHFGAWFACLAGLCGIARAETLYRWVDAGGATRISRDQPGSGTPYTAFEVPDPVPWSNAPPVPSEIAADSRPSAQNLFKVASQSVYGVVGRLASRSDGKPAAMYGSAIAVTDKLAITNCHVIEAAGEEIYLGTGTAEAVEKARLVAANYLADRCVIGVRNMDLQPVAGIRAFDALEVGETVYAIGNPSRLDRTLSDGLLSAKRVMGELRFLQTSAPISPGSSGGGLFDGRGNLIGVTAFTLKGAQNINFAIPAEDFWK